MPVEPLRQTEVSEKKRFGKKLGRFFRNLLIVLILVGALAFYWVFYNKYADGERKGTLIKVTHRGNVFKTDEGEMWLSCRQTMNPEKFYFSVTNDSIASLLQVNYVQYRGAVPWRGDNKYIVTGVTPIRNPNQ